MRPLTVFGTSRDDLSTPEGGGGELRDRFVGGRQSGSDFRVGIRSRIESGTLAQRPAAGVADRVYFATDTGTLYRDSGSAWSAITAPADVSVRVYNDAIQSIPDATDTALAFNQERFDTSALHDVSTNSSRLTAPNAGKYVISGNVRFAGNATGFRQVYIRLNGGVSIAFIRHLPVAAGTDTVLALSTLYELAVNDYVELVVNQSSGGALNVNSSGNHSPEFMMVYQGRI